MMHPFAVVTALIAKYTPTVTKSALDNYNVSSNVYTEHIIFVYCTLRAGETPVAHQFIKRGAIQALYSEVKTIVQ